MIPFYDLAQEISTDQEALICAARRVIEGGQFVLGKYLEEFENAFAEYVGARYCVGVSSGLDALTLALRAQDIGPGDEVIVPAQTFIATWIAVSNTGATIVPVDVTEGQCLINADKIHTAISHRTKAIIPVHLFGHPADMDAIRAIAEQHGIFVLEDSAQAHGAALGDVKCGSLGDASAFSFYPTKNLGALGDGGAVTTNNVSLANRLRRLRNYGSDKKYIHNELGLNSRLDDLQAAFLSVRLKRLSADVSRRQIIAQRYHSMLTGIDQVKLTSFSDNASPAFHLYVVRVENRGEFMQLLRDQGIQSQIHYPIAPFNQGAYKNLKLCANEYPVARNWADQALSLPLGSQMSIESAEHVARAVINVYG